MLGPYLIILTCLQDLTGSSALRLAAKGPPICLGWREAEVWKNAVSEADLQPSNISSFGQCVGKVPASWVRKIDAMSHRKTIRYNYQGTIFEPDVMLHRIWVMHFARNNFGDADFLRVTDYPAEYKPIGSFDKSKVPGGPFKPRWYSRTDRKMWTSMSPEYFRVMTKSNFTLCPRSDRGYSFRFYEAALSYSIPVVSTLDMDVAPTVPLEKKRYPQMLRCIGYKYYTLGDRRPYVYRKDWAETNYRLFIKYQTFLEGDNTPPNCSEVRDLNQDLNTHGRIRKTLKPSAKPRRRANATSFKAEHRRQDLKRNPNTQRGNRSTLKPSAKPRRRANATSFKAEHRRQDLKKNPNTQRGNRSTLKPSPRPQRRANVSTFKAVHRRQDLNKDLNPHSGNRSAGKPSPKPRRRANASTFIGEHRRQDLKRNPNTQRGNRSTLKPSPRPRRRANASTFKAEHGQQRDDNIAQKYSKHSKQRTAKRTT